MGGSGGRKLRRTLRRYGDGDVTVSVVYGGKHVSLPAAGSCQRLPSTVRTRPYGRLRPMPDFCRYQKGVTLAERRQA